MVICKYFLEGRCRFGNRCFNEHVQERNYSHQDGYPDRQRHESPVRYNDSYRNRDRYTYYGDENRGYNERYQKNEYYSSSPQNPYLWHSGQYAQQQQQQDSSFGNRGSRNDTHYRNSEYDSRNYNQSQSVESRNRFDVLRSVENRENTGVNSANIDMVKEDAIASEKGKQWPLTCYFPFKGHPGLPGFEDISPEELRYEAYEAQKNNTFHEYVKSYSKAVEDARQRREMLKKPTPNVINAVKAVLSENINLDTDGVRRQLFFNTSDNLQSSPQANSQSQNFFSRQAPTPSSFGSGVAFRLGHLEHGSSGNVPGSAFAFSEPSSAGHQQVSEMESMQEEPVAPKIAAAASTFRFVLPSEDASKNSVEVTGKSGSGVYTCAEELTKEELEAFSAPTFTLGRIPVRPPPREMCF